MKVKAQIYSSQPPSRQLEPELVNTAKLIADPVTKIMHVFGLQSITCSPTQVGICTLNNVAKVDMPVEDMPEKLAAARPKVARLLSDLILLTGMLELQLEMSDKDLKDTAKLWEDLKLDPDADTSSPQPMAE